MNEPIEVIRYFRELMRSPRSFGSTSELGHIKKHSSTEKEELSKSGEIRNAK